MSRYLIRAAFLAVLSIALFYYVDLFRSALIDDTYITLQYARTLAENHTWGFYADQATNTATSPLNVILTALCSLAAPNTVDAAIWLCTLELGLMFCFLAVISRKLFNGYYFAAAAFLIIVSNPLIISTIGLESLLYSLLLIASLTFFLYKKWDGLAVSLALLTMTRPDGGLLFVVMFLMLGTQAVNVDAVQKRGSLTTFSWDRPLRLTAIYILCMMPWEAYSWFHFGSLLPDTLAIKLHQGWGIWKFNNGIYLYLKQYPVQAAFSFLTLGLLIFALVKADRQVKDLIAVLFMFGLLHFGGYSLLGVPPYHWYYVPLLIACILIGILGAAALFHAQSGSLQNRALLLALPVCFAAGTALFLSHENFAPKQMPIHTNWASAETYKSIGLWMKENVDPAAKIKLSGEVGTVAYYSRLHLVDTFSCRQDCGPPFSYRLEMYDRPINDQALQESSTKLWRISSSWVPAGSVALRH